MSPVMSWVFCVSGFVRWRVDLGALQDVDSYGELRVQWMEGSSCFGKGNEGKQHIEHGRNLPQSIVVLTYLVWQWSSIMKTLKCSVHYSQYSKNTFLLYALFFWEKWSFMTHDSSWSPNDFWQVESMKDPCLSRRDWWRPPENPKESGQICQHRCDFPMNFQQKNCAFCQLLSAFISFLAKITEGMQLIGVPKSTSKTRNISIYKRDSIHRFTVYDLVDLLSPSQLFFQTYLY